METAKAGIIPEEYLVEYVVDRVETTSTVWLGVTLGCARCHDHKYDPFRQKEFYQVFAYFNHVPERGRAIKVGNSPPLIKAPTADDQRQLARLEARRREAQREFDRQAVRLPDIQTRWERSADRKDLPADWGPTRDLVGLWSFEGNLQAAQQNLPSVNCEHGSPRFVSSPVGSGDRARRPNLHQRGRRGQVRILRQLFAGSLDSTRGAGRRHDRFPHDRCRRRSGLFGRASKGASCKSISCSAGSTTPSGSRRPNPSAVRPGTMSPSPTTGRAKPRDFAFMSTDDRRRVHVHLDELNQSFDTKEPLRIGGGGGPAGRFHGALDEVRIYDRVLDPHDVLILATPDPLASICAVPPQNGPPPRRPSCDRSSSRTGRRPRSARRWPRFVRSRKRSNASPARSRP